MVQTDKTTILDFMKEAKGTQLTKIARAGAMGSITLISGDEKECFLHLQCAFRLRTAEEVLIANLDMFYPTAAMEEAPSFVWSEFDWDVQSPIRPDHVCRFIFPRKYCIIS